LETIMDWDATTTATFENLEEFGAFCKIRTTLYHFDEWYYSNSYATPADEAPAGGDTASLSTFCSGYSGGRECSCSDEAKAVQYVEVYGATWGEYMDSSLYDRHNHMSILKDFKEHLVDVEGGMSSHSLLLPLNGAEIPELLLHVLVDALETPIYDESGYDEFCAEMEQEDWESWGRRDFYAGLNAIADDYDYEAEERYTEEALDEIMEQARQDGIIVWQAESATGGRWVDFDLLIRTTYDEDEERIKRDWERYARFLTRAQFFGMDPLLSL
jgi:hypothetical protein